MRGVHGDEVPVDGQNVRDRQPRRCALLIALQRRCPVYRDTFPALDIQIELRSISAERERRFRPVCIKVHADEYLFGKREVNQSERIGQWRGQVFAGPDTVIEQLKLQKRQVRGSSHFH